MVVWESLLSFKVFWVPSTKEGDIPGFEIFAMCLHVSGSPHPTQYAQARSKVFRVLPWTALPVELSVVILGLNFPRSGR